MHLNPYLSFNGDCEAAFKLYERCFGGKIDCLVTYDSKPGEYPVPPEWGKKIMHATLLVGEQRIMGADNPPGRYEKPKGFTITVGLSDPAAAERMFNTLSEGATILMPLQQTFWAIRFGVLTDRFGIPWAINCEQPA